MRQELLDELAKALPTEQEFALMEDSVANRKYDEGEVFEALKHLHDFLLKRFNYYKSIKAALDKGESVDLSDEELSELVAEVKQTMQSCIESMYIPPRDE